MKTKLIAEKIRKSYNLSRSYTNINQSHPARKFDPNLNALRGFLTLIVVLRHIIEWKYLDPSFFPEFLNPFIPGGILRVLIFFVISGYVTSLSNGQSLTTSKILDYLKKRFIRIYPFYALSLLLALAISTSEYSIATIFNNFNFLQIIFSEVIMENGPVWSLQYEIIYFLLFIPISLLNINPILLAFISISLGLFNYILYPFFNAPLISSYLYGLSFFSLGLIIARYLSDGEEKLNYTSLLSYIPLILCIGKINLLQIGIEELSIVCFGQAIEFPDSIIWFERAIRFQDLTLLPYCLIAVIAFSKKDFKYRRQISTILFILPAFGLLHLLNDEAYSLQKLLAITTLYSTSLILHFYNNDWLNNNAKNIVNRASWIGSISYAIFIFHFPLLFVFNRIEFFSGSATTFTIRLFVYMTTLILGCYFMEKKIQPLFKTKAIPKKTDYNEIKRLSLN